MTNGYVSNGYVSKETLRYLGIRNIFFKSVGGITAVVQPLFIEVRNMVVTSGNGMQPSGFLVMESDNGDAQIPVRAERNEGLGVSSCWTLVYQEPIPDALAVKIIELKKLARISGRRAEERFDVGLDRWRDFTLVSPVVELHGGKERVRCVIANVSFHGALVTGERSSLRIGCSCQFICTFTGEIRRVIQDAVLVNARNADDAGKFFAYSLHFSEPLSIIWQEKVRAFIGG